jgi:hypothetical protein
MRNKPLRPPRPLRWIKKLRVLRVSGLNLQTLCLCGGFGYWLFPVPYSKSEDKTMDEKKDLKGKNKPKIKLGITDRGKTAAKLPSFLGERIETPLDRMLRENLEKMNIDLTKSVKEPKER